MSATTTSSISEQINQIPLKKEALRKSFEALQSFSSTLIDFNIQWKDIEDHFSPMESSIYERFNSLPQPNHNKITRMESDTKLDHFCTNMDPVGLRNFIAANRVTSEDLALALKSASNPAVLVLDAIHGYYPDQISKKEGESVHWKVCVKMLEGLYILWDDVKEKAESLKDRAMALAVEWKGKLTDDNALHTMGFLHLIVIYGLVSEFKVDEILNYFVYVAKLRQAVSVVKPLGIEDKRHVIMEKLCSQSKYVEAMKLVHAFDLADKFPPASLVKAFLTDAKDKSLEIKKSGGHTTKAVKDANGKEIGALKAAISAVKELGLEKVIPLAEISERINEIEKSKEINNNNNKKQAAKAIPARRSAERKTRQPQQHRPSPNKRWKASPMTTPAPPPVTVSNPIYNSQLLIHTQAQPGLDGLLHTKYIPGPGPYGTVYSPIRGHDIPGISGTQLSSHGGARAGSPPPRPFYYSVESLAGTSTLQPQPLFRGYDALPDRIPPYGSTLYR